jgi:deoxyribose-phosphate aldolase
MITSKDLFKFIDLTSLNNDDHNRHIERLCLRAVELYEKGYEVAAICVFPNFVEIVKKSIDQTTIKTAVVGAGFPNSQSFLESKIHECKTAVQKGAEEVDIVINLGALREEDYQQVSKEIQAIKECIQSAQLKVILETGQLKPHQIKKACELSMNAGADFIKTSTGKITTGATPEAVKIMAQSILAHKNETGKTVGLKVSGGVRTKEDGMLYYSIVEEILGTSFMTPKHFRIGASSLINDLLD